ncbi:hypothetical protein [Vibrio agarivorans]|uniref:Regulatory protein GemA n=1 Tax=Vibrio agarivorans TaxID=153622 RepID=A0ABT7Y0T9_9VIBR|nr:hypothetical protein [Vibrio agarivorans]MDN2481658.1 hypothetical protein [Vibrio agarivorans]
MDKRKRKFDQLSSTRNKLVFIAKDGDKTQLHNKVPPLNGSETHSAISDCIIKETDKNQRSTLMLELLGLLAIKGENTQIKRLLPVPDDFDDSYCLKIRDAVRLAFKLGDMKYTNKSRALKLKELIDGAGIDPSERNAAFAWLYDKDVATIKGWWCSKN